MIRELFGLTRFVLRELCPPPLPSPPAEFLNLGKRALRLARQIAELGPRPPGSEAHDQLQSIISSSLAKLDCLVEDEEFTAQTPIGSVPMCNYIAKFSGEENRTVVISGHYDTIHPDVVLPTGRVVRCWRLYRQALGKRVTTPKVFLGANDGGSSTALLLEIARSLRDRSLKQNTWIAFFDGEEALAHWSQDDQTYGSRHQAQQWQQDGSLKQITALVNIDMVGSRNLRVAYDMDSNDQLRGLVWRVARRCGYARRFPVRPGRHMADDHIPFIQAGVPAVDIIDAEYGPGNAFWHTLEDSPDKLSAHSLGMIAHVVLEVLRELDCTGRQYSTGHVGGAAEGRAPIP